MRRPARTLADALDVRDNGLNLVRLVLASTVIVWHSFPLTGTRFPWPALAPFAGTVAVDGFFVVSGYLLAGSWAYSPRPLAYLRARALRILPAFWVCLVVVGFGFAPVAAALGPGEVREVFSGQHSAWRYVLDNSLLHMRFYDVAGTPADVPFPAVWNGSLWTLRWEALAYLGLLLLGVMGLLRRTGVALGLSVAAWAFYTSVSIGVVPVEQYHDTAVRLAVMFLIGVAVRQHQDVLPVGRAWTIGAALVVVVSWALPDPRVLSAPAIAYLVLVAGAHVRRRRWQLRDRDISYGVYIYGFPVQQSLILAFGAGWHPLALAVAALVATVPLAAASWVLVERPALRLKRRARARA